MFWHDYWWMVLVGILVLPFVSIAVFGYWLRRRSDVTLEMGTKCWDTFIKLISAFTVIVSGAMLFGKYIDQQEAMQVARQKEVARELSLREAEFLRQKLNFDTERHKRMLALLGEAKTLAARLASVGAPDKALVTRFEELYYADLIGVEKRSGHVEQSMVRFRRKLKQLPDAPGESLYDLSLELSRAVEMELKESEDAILLQHRAITNLLTPTK